MKERTPKKLDKGLLNEAGQTAVEYILILAVASVLAFKLGNLIKARILGESDNCTPKSTSFYCQIVSIYSGDNFKRFVIRR
jgi:Flp pilus assembly pilin Flp